MVSMVERAENQADEPKILTKMFKSALANFFNPSIAVVDVSFVKTL